MGRTTVRLTDYQLETLDKMVELGLYKNRSEAIRDAIEEMLKKREKTIETKKKAFRTYGKA